MAERKYFELETGLSRHLQLINLNNTLNRVLDMLQLCWILNLNLFYN